MSNRASKEKAEKRVERAARAYIDAVVEINRRHGMSKVPEPIYAQAVEETERALKRISPRR